MKKSKIDFFINNEKTALQIFFYFETVMFCARHFFSQVSKTTWNVSNCYVNLTNRFHVAWRLFSSISQLTTKCGKNKEVAIRTMRPQRDNLCELPLLRCKFSLRHWNLRNLTLHIGILPYKSLESFSDCTVLSRLYNAAASPASRLRSADSLAIIKK